VTPNPSLERTARAPRRRPPLSSNVRCHLSQDSPAVVYLTIAILMTAFSVLLLVVPFDLLVSGEKTREFMTAVSSALGETGTRLVFSIPCGLLAFAAFRQWRKDAK
jgi:hypothetical protein